MLKNNHSLEADPIHSITKLIAPHLKKVDEIIIDNSKGKSELIADITNHLVSSGGKRIRPILTILGAILCGYDSGYRHCNLAAAIELIHTATLLHDDVVDNSHLRRGKKTSNAIWGNKASILVGDYLLSAAFQLMVKDGSLEVLDILSTTSKIMSDGEVLQLTSSNDVEVTEEKYLEIISAKTAILFASATRIGAVITKAGNKTEKALENFGNNLGIAFQIMDDVLDYSAKTEILGKNIGDDFTEGKVTMPIIITYSNANNSEKKQLKQIFARNLLNEEKDQKSFLEVIDLMNKYNSLELSTKKARQYQAIAEKNLDLFPDSQEKNMLLKILEYSVNRQI